MALIASDPKAAVIKLQKNHFGLMIWEFKVCLSPSTHLIFSIIPRGREDGAHRAHSLEEKAELKSCDLFKQL